MIPLHLMKAPGGPMSDNTTIQIDSENGVTVVTFGQLLEHLDDHAVIEHQELLVSTARDAAPPHVIFDLSNVRLFGSTFIEVIFRVWIQLDTANEGRFALCGVSAHCLEVLQVTHLDQLWPIHSTRAEAIQQITAG